MTVVAAVEKMIRFSDGNIHDIEHFMKVWAFAKTIGEQEGLDEHTQFILELAAVVHDISCPLCREKYGSTNGKLQEHESPALIGKFFKDSDLDELDVKRISWLAAHHHTYTDVDGIDHRILLEADFLVNAGEKGSPKSAVRKAREIIFKTQSGTRLLNSMFLEACKKV